MPFLYKLKVFWPRVETRLLIALVFLPFGTPDSGSKFRRNQVFIRYHAASAGLTKGNRLSKRKRNVLRRASLFLSNMHYWPSVKWSIWLHIIKWPNSFFCILLDFLKFLNIFPGWLFHETSSFARPLRNLTHWSSLRSLLRTYERSTCSKSLTFCLPIRNQPMKKRTTPIYATCSSPIYNAPSLPPKILHKCYSQFVVGRL